MRDKIDKESLFVGAKIGRWKILSEVPKTNNHTYYTCLCDCGNERNVRGDSILSGASLSCGCLAREEQGDRVRTHGLSKHPLYNVHHDMMRRCYNEDRKDYKHYGGRGVRVRDGWEDITKFIEDMYPTFIEGLEIDRVDVNGDYEKSNCKWSTRSEQVINRRPFEANCETHIIDFKGKSLSIAGWSKELGIPASMISDRVTKLGWSIEKAFTEPPKIRRTRILIDGRIYNPKDIFPIYHQISNSAKSLGIKIYEYLFLLFKGNAEIEVYTCKEWVNLGISELAQAANTTELIPKVVDNFEYKHLITGGLE